MKLCGNVLGMKRIKTNEFGHMFAHSCPGMLISLHSLHTKNISPKLKSDEPNSRYIGKGIFWDQIWPNLGLNDGHAWARMGEHVTKLISLHSFHTKTISTKFHLKI